MKPRFLTIFLALNFISPAPLLRAAESPLVNVLGKSACFVSIESVNATVLGQKPQGFLDKATGRILIWRKVQPVGYTRTGSGIIIDPNGVIATNAHTVRDAGGVAVTLSDGTRVPAKILHLVPGTDIAFLYIQPPFPLTAVEFGNSDAAAIGTEVYTIGHSKWLSGSLVGGTIQGLGQENIGGAPHVTMLQVNFRVYQGDSGSPVLDAGGKLLGMVSAGETTGRQVTFAIASNLILAAYKSYWDSLKNHPPQA